VCACAEFLPFPDQSFGTVVASDVIEHTAYQAHLLRQAGQALLPGGVLFLATPNRFSLTPEPHVRVWGVGFLPRAWMRPYVRWVRGSDYAHITLLSVFDLVGLLRRSGFRRWQVLLPRLSRAELQRYPRLERWAVAVYHALSSLPVCRELLYLCGPLFHVVAITPEAE
jgi:SAM-dependent methyltransferase